MSDNLETLRPSPRELARLALALASGKRVNLSGLSDADARAVWRIVLAILDWWRELDCPLPEPDHAGRLSEQQVRATLNLLRLDAEDPNQIVAEIMSEPLLQAALSVLSALTAVAFRMEALRISAEEDHNAPSSPPGGDGP